MLPKAHLTSSLALRRHSVINICNNVASNDEGTIEQVQVKEHLAKFQPRFFKSHYCNENHINKKMDARYDQSLKRYDK